MTFPGPSSSSQCSSHAICHHHLQNLIGGYHSSNRCSFLDNDGVVLGIIELNCHLLATTIVCTIARTHMWPPGKSLVSLMKWLCHDIHLSSHENQWSASPDSLIRPQWNDLHLSCTGYFVQFEQVFHSSIQVRCMVFELGGLLTSGTDHPDHSLPDRNRFSQLRQ